MARGLLLVSVLSEIIAFLVSASPAHTYSTPDFPYGSQKVRGVGLGGWLVLQPWITPSLFDNTGNDDIVDEWTFCQLQSTSKARAALQNHWDTFYTEADFAAIAKAGLNHVIVPIGYWAFEVGPGEPFIQGQLPYLKKAIKWASKYELKVIISLYGAPGSQNGFIDSGHLLSFPQWQSNSTNVARTDAIIKTIANIRDDTNVVSAVAPLNEPAGYDGPDILSVVQKYYADSYESIRSSSGSSKQSNTLVMIHDSFQNITYWDSFFPSSEFHGIAIDTHIYQGFPDDGNTFSQQEHIAAACATADMLNIPNLWTIVGEWSPVTTDCAKYLNGRGFGAKYDGSYPNSTRVGSCTGMSGSASTFSESYKAFLRKYWEAQAIAYEAGGLGWSQWTWKTESGAGEEWSYEVGLKHGWIPSNATLRKYPTICG